MKQKLRLGDYYALTKHKLRHYYVRYISLLAVLTSMCLYARAQRPEPSGPVPSGIDTTSTTRDTIAIEEVEINTGYQRIPKERATGSFVFVDSALLNRAVSTDIISRLKGVVPSLLFDERAGGEPKLSIRGRSTIFANADPLIVVDNFPYEGDIRNINPNDVESVSILRDAAAASIWGVRAGNGVIVITTKKGKAGQPLQVSFNGNVTVGKKPDLWYGPRINAVDQIAVEQFLFEKGYFDSDLINVDTYPVIPPAVEILGNPVLSEAEKSQMIASLSLNDVRRDIDNYFYQQSISQRYALNFKGGTDRYRYRISSGFDRNREHLVGNLSNRVSLSSQSTINPIEKLEINIGVNYALTNRGHNSASHGLQNLRTYTLLADDSGNHLAVPRGFKSSFLKDAEERGLLNWEYRPLDELDLQNQKSSVNHLRLNSNIDYTWFTGFSTSMLYQYEQQGAQSDNLMSQDMYEVRDRINRYASFGESPITWNVPLGAYYHRYFRGVVSHNGRIQAAFQSRMGLHDISTILGGEWRQTKGEGGGQVYHGYDISTGIAKPVNYDSLYSQYPLGGRRTIVSPPNISGTVDRFRSFFINGSYKYADRYFVSVSGRIDQSNLFGVKANQRSIPLWSVGLKWKLSDELFFEMPLFSQIGIRATYGYNGNTDNGVTALTTARYSQLIGTGVTQATIQTVPNSLLRWERIGVLNLGIDFTLRDNTLNGTVDYFKKRGLDLLGNGVLDPTTGRTGYRGNVAGMKGEGVDLSLTFMPLTGKTRWAVTFLGSYATDRITRYELEPSVITSFFEDASLSGSGYTPIVDRPLFSIYSYPWAGLHPESGLQQGFLDGSPSTDLIQVVRQATLDSLVYHGRATPSWFGAFRNTFSYGNFSVSFNVLYKMGYYYRNRSVRYDQLYASGVGHGDFAKRWRQKGDESTTYVPAMVYPLPSGFTGFYQYASVHVQRADHIRLQDIRLTYTLSSKQLRSMGINQAAIYCNANNVSILWRRNSKGIDPDFSDGVLPTPLSCSVGATLQF